MLLLLKNYVLLPAFRLNPSVLPVATRRFLTTSQPPDNSLSQAQAKAPSKAKKTGDKPKHFFKKDLMPPKKRPSTGFVAFSTERARKAKESSPTAQHIPFLKTLRESADVWKQLSDAEKKSYNPPPGAFEEYKAYAAKFYEGLSDEAKKALKIRRMRKQSTGFNLFLSENYKTVEGDKMGDKISALSKLWKTYPAEKKAEYSERAKVTSFGIIAKRAARRERDLERATQAKIKAAADAKRIADKKKMAIEKVKQEREALKKKARELKKAGEKEKLQKEKLKMKEKTKARKEAPSKGKKAGSAGKQTTKAKVKSKGRTKA